MHYSKCTYKDQNINLLVSYRYRKPSLMLAQLGVQLIELIIAVAILAIIGTIAVPSYSLIMDRVDNAQAMVDIKSIEQAIERFYVQNNRYPDNLVEIGFNNLPDPWDNTYQYLRINGVDFKGKAAFRKDKNLNPVNSDYDLYSMGKDGLSKGPFTAKASKDDVVRANNGRFVGLAEDY